MTVSQCRADFFVYNKELYHFLWAIQQNCLRKNCTQIASVSIEIDPVDPLVVFSKLGQPQQINFYWENKSKKEAIASFDAAAKLEITGKNRFKASEDFIKDCLEKTVCFSEIARAFSKPLFLCSFSFFEEPSQADYPFPSATIFLPCWQVAVKNNRYTFVANIPMDANVDIQKILQVLWSKLETISSLNSLEYSFLPLKIVQPKLSQQYVANPEQFKRSVSGALESIQSKRLRKVVLADALDVRASIRFNLLQSLNNLRQLHSNCCIFSISNGKGQNFIGASPERLIGIDKQQLITDALAGSAPRGKTPAEDAVNASRLLSSEKERHEHSLVIDFITQRLSQLGLLPQVLRPRLRQLSNIQHLWTPINAIVPNNVHPLSIVAQLHPTPAVAGASREIACREIRRYENFERGLYAAPLGWVDSEGNCEFIVGIRSALIDGDRARLYAGAGIVAGSNPDKELAEVQLKLQALLRALV
ncbi:MULTISPECIES: isochorismate synthase [Nostocales]|uniref:isochorismate synthase n=4 Tax=Nostocales TaxID=1161 RepID=A0A8S9T2U4_9CYAN|nr:isochorismate synthase [Tolypothrix bouteillei]KAF3886004.1 isochorismate synthase [Tolypothrix bouteillei VB521301]